MLSSSLCDKMLVNIKDKTFICNLFIFKLHIGIFGGKFYSISLSLFLSFFPCTHGVDERSQVGQREVLELVNGSCLLFNFFRQLLFVVNGDLLLVKDNRRVIFEVYFSSSNLHLFLINYET